MTLSTQRCIDEPGLYKAMKEELFLERENVKNNFYFYNKFWGVFFCCSQFFFKTGRNKLRLIFMVQLALLRFNFFFFLHVLYSKIWIWLFFFKYKKTIFLSKASRIIHGCSTGPRRFCFMLESAAFSYNDFVWPTVLWWAGAGNNLSFSHQNIPLWASALLLSLKYLVSILTRGETDVRHH